MIAGVVAWPPAWHKHGDASKGAFGAVVEFLVEHGPLEGVVVLSALDLRSFGSLNGFPGSPNNVLVVVLGFLKAEAFHFV